MVNRSKSYSYPLSSHSFDYIPLNEYPRPSLQRNNYLCLNGYWLFHIGKEDYLPESFSSKILVPYAVESLESGVHHFVEPDEYLHYERQVFIPEKMRDDVIIIHFEGVDQEAKIYVDHQLVMTHVGGYDAFEVKIPYTKSFLLSLVVKDQTDLSYLARGKQTLHPSGWFYSSSSGIYKSVWLECVPLNHLKSIKYYPDFTLNRIGVLLSSDQQKEYTITFDNQSYQIKSNELTYFPLDKVHYWSSEDPYLYQVDIVTKDEQVHSYFAFRQLEVNIRHGFPTLFLNHQPLFLNGLLDQGYYVGGNLTPLSHQDYLTDLQNIKDLGFNCLRIHIKTEDDLFYYYADQLGVYLIQDFVNGGNQYDFLQVVKPRLLPFLRYDSINEKKTGRESDESKKAFYQEVEYYINHFNNNPSVLIYTIFNEAWGEFMPNELYQFAKSLDKNNNHLFDTASGWLDATSDFYSVHSYTFPNMKRKDRFNRPFIFSEIGGLGYKDINHSYFEGYFSHFPSKTLVKLEKNYSRLYIKKLIPQIVSRGVVGIIYTQLNDCESEYNGIYTFDRKVLKINKDVIKNINQQVETAFDKAMEE